MATPDITPIAGTASELGESPFWDQHHGRLHFVDIVGRAVAVLDPSSGAVRRHATADFPTAIALRRGGGGAVVSFAGGVALFDLETGTASPLAVPDPTPGNRLNEGKCDPQGRFWAGSMQTNLEPDGSERAMDRNSGALFRVDADGTVTQHSPHDIGISNTMAWTADGGTFYFGDSLRNTIFAYDFDAEAGVVSNRRVHFEGFDRGVPDGSCIDEDGCLWNARYGGGCIVRVTPAGKVDRVIDLPVTNATSCAFGGSAGDTLFVTSSRVGIDPAARAANPSEGAVLAIAGLGRGAPGAEFG